VKTLKLLIVDDETPARTRLRNLLDDLAAQLPTLKVVEAADGVEAIAQTHVLDIDIALVDIQMPRMNGIELARHFASLPKPPSVIFTTAYDQYAVKAFELSAVEYLLKPVKAARLAEALGKAMRAPSSATGITQAAEAIEPGGRKQLRCLERGKVLLVPVADVLYFKADQKYVTAHTREREYLLEESLAHLEAEFAKRFMRIHRNCLVARAAITGYERDQETPEEAEPRWSLLLHGLPERLPVSRRLWPQVKAALVEA
jgi:two-component system response regulator AlgR